MDTRGKILDGAAAAQIAGVRRVRLVTGYFDPLLAAHARRLEGIRAAEPDTPLMVAVVDPPLPILPRRARAELVAALRAVDYVVAEDVELRAAEVIHEERADLTRTKDLIEHVQRCHTA